jgi:hypothetical protein
MSHWKIEYLSKIKGSRSPHKEYYVSVKKRK